MAWCGERGVGVEEEEDCVEDMWLLLSFPLHPFSPFPYSSFPISFYHPFIHFSCQPFPSLYLFFLTSTSFPCLPSFSLHSISLPSHSIFVATVLSFPCLIISLVPSHCLPHLFPPYLSISSHSSSPHISVAISSTKIKSLALIGSLGSGYYQLLRPRVKQAFTGRVQRAVNVTWGSNLLSPFQ